LSKQKLLQGGFTLIEAMVSMAIFGIGFAGLYLFYGMSQTSIVNSDKKLYMSLVADSIVETVANESRRPSSDPLNPFTSPAAYSGSLETCSYPTTDIRKTWCDNLVNTVGPFNGASGREVRSVKTQLDSGSLLVDVALIADSGMVSVYLSRRIRP